MKTIYFDLETQSLCDLKVHGSWLYAHHPSTRIVLVTCIIDRKLLTWQFQNEPRPEWMDQFNGARLIAHNGFHFDYLFLDRLDVKPAELHDSMYCCLANGLRGGLEIASKTQYGVEEEKDQVGRAVMKVLSKPVKGKLPIPRPAQLRALTRYAEGDNRMGDRLYHDLPHPTEQDLILTDWEINKHGFRIDRPFTEKLLEIERDHAQQAGGVVEKMTNGIKARSIKLREWLAEEGVEVPNLRRDTVDRLLSGDDLPDAVKVVLSHKLESSANTAAKLQRMLDRADANDYVRFCLLYYGAHTGRWAGRAVQPHNFPRFSPPKGEYIDDWREAFLDGDPLDSDKRKALLRTCILPDPGEELLIIDWAAIEARVLAWIAGEEWLLNKFRNDEDIYVDMAAIIFGCGKAEVTKSRRQVGKVVVLGSGYCLGGGRLGDYMLAQGIDLSEHGLDPFKVIEQFRNNRLAIAGKCTGGVVPGVKVGLPRKGGLWKRLQYAFKDALVNQCRTIGRCQFETHGTAGVNIVLPSGRPLVYRRIHERVWGDRTNLGYSRNIGHFASIYGGKLTENIVQAISRDLLAHSLVTAYRKNYKIILHVHDEIVLSVPQGSDPSAIMADILEPPEWAAGLPIKAEAFTAPWYTKAVPRGVREITHSTEVQ